MDLVVGNVPFADVVPHDSTHNRLGLSLHNYFIFKSLHLVRPGGVVAVLTSRWTMDAANPKARDAFAGMADLVAAVRLPNQTHQQAAGTDVITDVLVFRRRVEGEEPVGLTSGWRDVEPLPPKWAGPRFEGAEVTLNSLFAQQPGRVIGRLTAPGRGAESGRAGGSGPGTAAHVLADQLRRRPAAVHPSPGRTSTDFNRPSAAVVGAAPASDVGVAPWAPR
jgi:hypothetical protein